MILVFGGTTGGLGTALVSYLADDPNALHPVGRAECDVTNEDSVRDFFQTRSYNDVPLHIINATGGNVSALLHKMTWEDFDKVMRVNVGGSFLLLKHAAPVLTPGSTITLFSSVVPRVGVVGTAAYAASKSALMGLVRTAALELARKQVRVNAIELGYFEHGMIRQVPDAMRESVVQSTPLRRLGRIEDLWATCDFLMRCEFITGALVPLTGGL